MAGGDQQIMLVGDSIVKDQRADSGSSKRLGCEDDATIQKMK